MTYLINLLTTGDVPYDTDHTIYAELLDGKFRPESLVVVVAAGEEAPSSYNPFAPFADGVSFRDEMRELLWMDYDPDHDPEEYWDQELNYPENNAVFDPEFMRDSCMALIRQKNAALVAA